MMYNINMKIAPLIDRIDELLEKLENPDYKRSVIKAINLSKDKKYRASRQNFKLIAYILNSEKDKEGEDSFFSVSNTTIYRLIKIREKDPELYKKVHDGEVPIRRAFETLNSNRLNRDITSIDNGECEEEKCVDYKRLYKEIHNVNTIIEQEGEEKEVSLSFLKELDTEIYNLRKNVGRKISSFYEENN